MGRRRRDVIPQALMEMVEAPARRFVAECGWLPDRLFIGALRDLLQADADRAKAAGTFRESDKQTHRAFALAAWRFRREALNADVKGTA